MHKNMHCLFIKNICVTQKILYPAFITVFPWYICLGEIT